MKWLNFKGLRSSLQESLMSFLHLPTNLHIYFFLQNWDGSSWWKPSREKTFLAFLFNSRTFVKRTLWHFWSCCVTYCQMTPLLSTRSKRGIFDTKVNCIDIHADLFRNCKCQNLCKYFDFWFLCSNSFKNQDGPFFFGQSNKGCNNRNLRL